MGYIFTGIDDWDLKIGGVPSGGLTVLLMPMTFPAPYLNNKMIQSLKNCVLIDKRGDVIRDSLIKIRSGGIKLLSCMDVNHIESNMIYPTIEECIKVIDKSKIMVYINDAQEVFDVLLKQDKKTIRDFVGMEITTIAVIYRGDMPFNKKFADDIDNMASLIMEVKGLGKDYVEVNVLRDETGFTSKEIMVYI